MVPKAWSDILEISQRCPSPHNVQPWKVKIHSDSSCTVYVDNARTLPKEDTTGSFIRSGMVMYLETMRLAAELQHCRLAYTLLPEQAAGPDGLVPFAAVAMHPDSAIKPTFHRDVFYARQTSRLSQLPQPVSGTIQQALQATAASFHHNYGYTTDGQRIHDMLSQDILALFQDLGRPNYHDEIVSWFRFSGRTSRKHHDGLDARCMNISVPEYFVSAKAPFIFRLPVLKQLFIQRYRSILGKTHCIGWLSGKFWEPEDAVVAGKLLVHFWLQLTTYGLYIHPFGNLVTNKEARKWFESATKTDDIWFVFRIGYTPRPPLSYRKPVEEILL